MILDPSEDTIRYMAKKRNIQQLDTSWSAQKYIYHSQDNHYMGLCNIYCKIRCHTTFTDFFSFLSINHSMHNQASFVCLKNVNKAPWKMTIFYMTSLNLTLTSYEDSIMQNTILLFEKGSLGNYCRMFGPLICITLRKQMLSLCGGVLLPEYLERWFNISIWLPSCNSVTLIDWIDCELLSWLKTMCAVQLNRS